MGWFSRKRFHHSFNSEEEFLAHVQAENKKAEEEELKKKLLHEMKDAVWREDAERRLRKHYHPKSFIICWFTDDMQTSEIEMTKEQFDMIPVVLDDVTAEFVYLNKAIIRKSSIKHIQWHNFPEYYTCYDEHKEPEPFWKDGEIDQRFEEKSEQI